MIGCHPSQLLPVKGGIEVQFSSPAATAYERRDVKLSYPAAASLERKIDTAVNSSGCQPAMGRRETQVSSRATASHGRTDAQVSHPAAAAQGITDACTAVIPSFPAAASHAMKKGHSCHPQQLL
jgi:hypothetical protein